MSGKLLRLFILILLALTHGALASGQERSDVTKVPIEPQSKSVTIVSKPNPEGQKEGSGEPQITLTLRAIFRSDGSVTDVHFVKATPKDAAKGIVKEFKKRAIEAAKQIKFTPATKDGRPVPSTIFAFRISRSNIKTVHRTNKSAPRDSSASWSR